MYHTLKSSNVNTKQSRPESQILMNPDTSDSTTQTLTQTTNDHDNFSTSDDLTAFTLAQLEQYHDFNGNFPFLELEQR